MKSIISSFFEDYDTITRVAPPQHKRALASVVAWFNVLRPSVATLIMFAKQTVSRKAASLRLLYHKSGKVWSIKINFYSFKGSGKK